MIIKSISSKDSQRENLETWCYEVGTRFEELNINAADELINCLLAHKIKNKLIFDLGCGDGAAIKQFLRRKYDPVGVDINTEKLRAIEASTRVLNMSFKNFLISQSELNGNIFAHHSLEHSVDAPSIIMEIGSKMTPGNIYYAAVPAEDYLHSVHHVVFESAEELLPPNCCPLRMEKRERFGEKEFVCMALRL